MGTATENRTPSGQLYVSPEGRDTTAPDTTAVVDPTRCVHVGGSEDHRGAVWVAVVGPRDEVTDDPAKRLAEKYWLGFAMGGIERAYGPFSDDPVRVMPPADPDRVTQAPTVNVDTYLHRAAEANVGKRGDRYVCYYLVRTLR